MSRVSSLGQEEDPLEKEMTTHSSTLAWRIPWTEEPGGLQSMGLQRVTHSHTQLNSFTLHILMFHCEEGLASDDAGSGDYQF